MRIIRLVAALLLLSSTALQAENMIMLRVDQSFDNTMILMKEKLNEYGYKIAHIQKCDGGLTDSGYQTDLYKSIFYGKFEEMRTLTKNHPELIPYLPLKIAVIKEKDTILMVSLNPSILSEFFSNDDLQLQFGRWESDIRAIFEEVDKARKL
jgi:uncharacterized protein (DUF302 family)